MTNANTWGRIYAIINRVLPGRLSSVALTNITQAPGLHFGSYMAMASRRLVKQPDLDKRLEELINLLPPEAIKDKLTVAQQGQFWLGWYAEKGNSPNAPNAPGRPEKGSVEAVDWSSVDWALSNVDLARELGVARQTVAAQRKRHGPKDT